MQDWIKDLITATGSIFGTLLAAGALVILKKNQKEK